MSEGLSVQYDDTSRSGPAEVVAVQKWRIHFAKPPSTAIVAALAKPVTTATLVQKLELDEEAVGLCPLSAPPYR
jgi:hypothetical protein